MPSVEAQAKRGGNDCANALCRAAEPNRVHFCRVPSGASHCRRVCPGIPKADTAEARNHVGETATVCGHVASTHYAARSHEQPTFINLDKPYPNSPFTVVIWGSDRDKFGAPETAYQDRDICVTGQIKQYRNAPEIVASDPKQIKIR